MTERRSFYRKLGYLGGIVVLLFPLAILSTPATVKSQGGKLAELRKEYDLAQANLGEIDPGSEAMKLATLGLRGVAVNLLWNKAHHYKKTENWTKLTAVLEQLAKLQPNYISFWKFQAWNVSYNVSVEFDDYHDRYYYVIRGINFLKEGVRYNQTNKYIPRLLSDVGWFIGQKIGRADEHVQYRRLFKTDKTFHPNDRPLPDRDNWLVSKEWYDKAVDAVDNKGKSFGKANPVVFYSKPAMSLLNYAETIAEEGAHRDKMRTAWKRAGEEWDRYGQHPILHSTGMVLILGEIDRLKEQVDMLAAKLENLLPGTRQAMVAERRATLSDAQSQAYETPALERTEQQHKLFYEAEQALNVSDDELAERIAERDPEKEKEARLLAHELEKARRRWRYTRNYRETANYTYWETRAQYEKTEAALTAREKTYLGIQEYEESRLREARRLFEEGLAKWREVLDQFPAVVEDTKTGDDLIDMIKKYRRVLDQDDQMLDESFPLWEIIEEHDRSGDFEEELKLHRARQEARGLEGSNPPPPRPSGNRSLPAAGDGDRSGVDPIESDTNPTGTSVPETAAQQQ